MGHARQLAFQKRNWKHDFNHGGILRRRRLGRGLRPLSTKEPLHAVFKINRDRLREKTLRGPRTYCVTDTTIKRYAKMFFVKLEQVSIQNDHIHLLIRTKRRSQFHHFFRVLSGQMAQVLEKEGLLRKEKTVTDTPSISQREELREPKFSGIAMLKLKRGTGLWKFRPFSRVVCGWRAFKIARDYIQLNEMEVLGLIPYRKDRLKGLSSSEWELLWS